MGDSLSDLDMAAHVNRFFLVANGGERCRRSATAAEKLPNVTICDDSVGLGWAQAAGGSSLGAAASAG